MRRKRACLGTMGKRERAGTRRGRGARGCNVREGRQTSEILGTLCRHGSRSDAAELSACCLRHPPSTHWARCLRAAGAVSGHRLGRSSSAFRSDSSKDRVAWPRTPRKSDGRGMRVAVPHAKGAARVPMHKDILLNRGRTQMLPTPPPRPRALHVRGGIR